MDDNLIDTILGAIVTTIIAAIASIFMRMRKAESKVDTMEDKVDRLEDKEKDLADMKILSARIEERLKHLPTHKDLQLLHDRISQSDRSTREARETIAGMKETMNGLRSAVNRLSRVIEK